MQLEGGVTIITSTGYRLATERLAAALDRTHVHTDSAVEAEGPPGRIHAGGMELTEGAVPGSYELVFTGGVKLVYDPQAAPPP
jgi:lipopolysaccharide export system protein LptC